MPQAPDTQLSTDNSSGQMPFDPWRPPASTGALVFRDGRIIRGQGLGAVGHAAAEVCFNTAITGYQEILTDPSYAGQIVTFTFPHIGNVGANDDDIETFAAPAQSADRAAVRGCIVRASVTDPSNYRSLRHLDAWLAARGIIGLCGVDTRALTNLVRESGMPNAVIAHAPDARFDPDALKAEAAGFPGLDGMDLVPSVTSSGASDWSGGQWSFANEKPGGGYSSAPDAKFHVVALDFGIKQNILRLLATHGCRITIVPAQTPADDILALKPDGIFLSNGPGDPAATGEYAVPTIKALVASGLPVFGICLGHQMLGLALGGQTVKMHQGHHGANHPVKDHTTGKVEIVSMNHGFAIDGSLLPDSVEETHVSLFDGSNCGLRLSGRPVFSVQHHPEASPGPMDSHYLFQRFMDFMAEAKTPA